MVKLATLAGFTVVTFLAAVGSHSAPRWLVPCSGVLALLLVAGAASFVVSSPALTAALYTSLPLLLLWAGAVGLTIGRRTSPHSAPTHASVR